MGRRPAHDLEPFKARLLYMRETISVDQMLEWLAF